MEDTAAGPLAPLDRRSVAVLADAVRASRSPEADDGPKKSDVREAFAVVDLALHGGTFDRARLRQQAVIGATLVMRALPKPRQTFVHLRGDYLAPDTARGPLTPDTPAILPPLRSGDPAAETATRLDLARWLVRPDNPLTPRVTVNRVWMRFFGTGLVETENDFGTQGTPGTTIRTEWNTKEIWMRRTVTLGEVPAGDLFFRLHHDEDAEIFVNGVLAATVQGYVTEYVEVPLLPAAKAALVAGENLVAVHCRQTGGGQSIDVGIVERLPAQDTAAR